MCVFVYVCIVMVNFMCQLNWAKGCSDTLFIIILVILGVSVMFLYEIKIYFGRLSKAECPPHCGGYHSVCLST